MIVAIVILSLLCIFLWLKLIGKNDVIDCYKSLYENGEDYIEKMRVRLKQYRDRINELEESLKQYLN